MSHFFKRYWDEPRGDEHDAWGCSWWYFEADEDGWIVRQIEQYDHGPTLAYDADHPEDEYGGLGDQALDLEEFEQYRITAEAFGRAWPAARG